MTQVRCADIYQLENYDFAMEENYRKNLGKILKQQRLAVSLTLQELSDASGVSPSHIGRVERGNRFPSAAILRRIAKPLGFEENELFTLAGYLSPRPPMMAEQEPVYSGRRLDPHVARILAQEPLEIQQAVVGILTIVKSIAASMAKQQAQIKDKPED